MVADSVQKWAVSTAAKLALLMDAMTVGRLVESLGRCWAALMVLSWVGLKADYSADKKAARLAEM